MRQVYRIGMASILGVTLVVAQSSVAKNPPRLKGKTPPDTFVASEPEYFPAVPTPGLNAPPGYDTMNVDGAKKQRYSDVDSSTVLSRKLSSNAQSWWQVGVNAVDVQTTQFRGVVSPVTATRPLEPVITSLSKAGTSYTVAAWMDWDHSTASQSKLWAARITHNSTGGGFVEMATELNRTIGYDRIADPVLACNPYTDGVAPGRVYLAGLSFARDQFGQAVNPNAIHVWGSGDTGKTWDNGGSLVQQTAENAATPYRDPDLDKPAIDVSWHPGTRGYLYVAWVEWHYANGSVGAGQANKIRFRRSVNGASRRCRPTGGICDNPFEPSFDIDNGGSLAGAQRPQVVVNPLNGEVYVLWVTGNRIAMRTAPAIPGKNIAGGRDMVASDFGPAYTVATLRSTYLEIRPGFPILPVPIVRFNHITNKLMVVWHDRPSSSSSDSAVYLAYFTPSSLAAGQPTPVTINNAAGFQFQPTIDNDDSGNMMISYYSSEHDTVNHFFKPYAILRDSTGTAGGTLKGPTAIDGDSGNWPGDYRDLWYFGFMDSVGPRAHTVYNFTGSGPDTRVTGIK